MELFIEIPIIGLPPSPWSSPQVYMKRSRAGKVYKSSSRSKSLDLWQRYVRTCAEGVMAGRPVTTKPLYTTAGFCFRNDDPRSHRKLWCPQVVWEPKKSQWVKKGPSCPDTDNLFKSTMDALQGVVFGNDCQICEQTASRSYDQHDGVLITVWTLDEEVFSTMCL